MIEGVVEMDESIVLIPYIDPETGDAEIWIGGYAPEVSAQDMALRGLAEFADMDQHNRAGILEHCETLYINKTLLPTKEPPVYWYPVTITDVLAPV